MILVAYYSLSGKTAALAREVATALQADLLAIEDVKRRRGFFGFMRSGYESVRGKLPKIKTQPPDMTAERLAAYDGVILMSPVWAGSISSPLRSFVTRCRAGIGRYALLVLCGDAKEQYSKAREAVQAISGAAPIYYQAFCPESPDYSAKVAAATGEISAMFAQSAD